MKKKCLTLMTVAASLSFAVGAFAYVPAGSVNTAAIENGAVTAVKIANSTITGTQMAAGAVSNAKLADGAVTAVKIATGTITATQMAAGAVSTTQLADGAVTAAKLATGTITGTQLADGAVTDAKITGPISTSKLSVGTAAGTVAAGDHNHDGLYQKKYGKVVVVAKSGGDYSDPYAAVNSITDASATNPYLVKIMPGVYDIGANSIQMKSFVDIEGSGENTTKILGTTGNVHLWGASDAELSHLTLESSSAQFLLENQQASPKISNVTLVSSRANGIAIDNYHSSAIFTDVTVVSSGGGENDVNWGIRNIESAPTFTNLKLDVSSSGSAFGIGNCYSPSTFRNLVVTVSGANSEAIYNIGNPGDQSQLMVVDGATVYGASTGLRGRHGMLQITNSTISAPTAVDNYSADATTFIANTMIDGAIGHGGTYKCVSVYDGNFDIMTCP